MIPQNPQSANPSPISLWGETERQKSAISPEIWALNTVTISPDDTDWETGQHLAYSYLLYGGQGFSRFFNERHNSLDGKWGHLKNGGVWFEGYKHGDDAWGIFKPIAPKMEKKGDGRLKPRKYEQPQWQDAGIIVPRLREGGDLLAPYREMADEGKSLIITEGAKKALAGSTAGYPTIAVPGHTMAAKKDKEVSRDENGRKVVKYKSEPKLISEIIEIIGLGFKEIFIAFDSESEIKQQKLVNKSASRLKELIAASFKNVRVTILRWDNAKGKGLDDYLVNGGDIPSLIESSKEFLIKEWKKRQSLTRDLPTIEVECTPYSPTIPVPSSPIVAVKAPKGTGKTELLSHWIKERNGEGIVVSLYHLNQLGENSSKRLGIPFNNSMSDDEREHLFNRLNKKYFTEEDLLGFASNIASLVKKCRLAFEVGEWAHNDMWMIFDECEQLIASALLAPIFEENRMEILSNLIELMNLAYRKGKFICLDADLSDYSIDFIKDFTGATDKDFCLINGTKQAGNPRKAIFYNQLPSLLTEIVARLSQGKSGAIATSAQKPESNTAALNLERWLLGYFPNLSILRIDSESIVDPTHPAYACVAENFPGLSGYDLAIYTPCIETGVDLNPVKMGLNWDFVAMISYGVQSPERFCQSGERFRGDCDRLIFVPDEASGGFLKNGGAIYPEKIEMSLGEFFKDKINFSEIKNWELWGKLNYHYARFIARENLGRKCYKAAIAATLEASGYELIYADSPTQKQILSEIGVKAYHLGDNAWEEMASGTLTVSRINPAYQDDVESALVGVGVKKAEFRRMVWGDVDWENKTIAVPRKKDGVITRYPLTVSDEIISKLEALKAVQGITGDSAHIRQDRDSIITETIPITGETREASSQIVAEIEGIKSLREVRDESWDESITARYHADDLDKYTAADLEGSLALTPSERAALGKWQIQKRYGCPQKKREIVRDGDKWRQQETPGDGIPLTKELIKADDEGLYRAARLRYGLMVASPLPSPVKSLYLRDEIPPLKHLTRLKGLDAVGFLQLLGKDFSPAHATIAAIATIPQEQFDFIFGKPGKGRDRGMARVRVISELLGYSVKSTRKREGDKVTWTYSLTEKWEGIDFPAIFRYWQNSERESVVKSFVMTDVMTESYLLQGFVADIGQSPEPAPGIGLGDCWDDDSLYKNKYVTGHQSGEVSPHEIGATATGDVVADIAATVSTATGDVVADITATATGDVVADITATATGEVMATVTATVSAATPPATPPATLPTKPSKALSPGERVLNFLNQNVAVITDIFVGRDGETYAGLQYADYSSASPIAYLQPV